MSISRDDLISRSAAAMRLGIHPNTLDREVKRAGLRRFHVRGDNRVFFLRAEIDQHVDPIIEITDSTSGTGTATAPGAEAHGGRAVHRHSETPSTVAER